VGISSLVKKESPATGKPVDPTLIISSYVNYMAAMG
jgi:hypothetical protein